jgi:hypothetical protein
MHDRRQRRNALQALSACVSFEPFAEPKILQSTLQFGGSAQEKQ